MKTSQHVIVIILLCAHATTQTMTLSTTNRLLLSASAGILVTGTLNTMIRAKENSLKNNLPHAPYRVDQYVRQQIKAIGIKNPDVIQIRLYEDPGEANHDTIFLNKGEAGYVDWALRWGSANDERVLQFKAAAQHEANHIKYNDRRNSIFVAASSISALTYAMTSPSTLLSGLTILLCLGANHACNCYDERRADDNIENDPAMLRARAKYFRQYAQDYDQYATLFQRLTDTHPHPLKRAQKFEERAAIAELALLKKDS